MMKRPAAAMLLLLLLGGAAVAADIRAFVDRTRMTLEEAAQLTIAATGESAQVDLSPITDFQVVSSGTSTSVQIVDGRMTREVRNTYTIIPVKEGRLRIPPLWVESGGKRYKTGEIIIQVSLASPKPAQEQNIRVTSLISSADPFEGQQIVYTFRLHTAVQIANARFQPPNFTGFTAKEVGERKSYPQVVSGREYQVTELQFVLVPLASGATMIEPAVLQCDIVRRKQQGRSPFGSFFDDPFFGRAELEPRIFRTQPHEVKVRPLPAYTGPGEFSGLVGKFDIRADIDAVNLGVGDSTTLTVVIEGAGNIMDAAQPKVPAPGELKQYTDAPEEEIRLDASGFSGKKAFRTALVPVKAGAYTIEPVPLIYFDTHSQSYVTRSTEPVLLRVDPSAEKEKPEIVLTAPEIGDRPGALKKRVEFTGRDILPLKEDLDAVKDRKPLPLQRFLLLLAIPVFMYTALRIGMVLTRKVDHPAAIMADRAEEALKQAGRPGVSEEDFLAGLYRGIVSIVFSRAGVKGETLTTAETKEILLSNGFSDEIAARAAGLLERIESTRYSGLIVDPSIRKDMLSETRALFKRLCG